MLLVRPVQLRVAGAAVGTAAAKLQRCASAPSHCPLPTRRMMSGPAHPCATSAASASISAALLADLAAASAAAAERIRPHTRRTPLEPSPWLRDAGQCAAAYIKLESEQATGSFKARGAIRSWIEGAVNKLLTLSPAQLAAGLVTCSTGNHALAFVHAAARVGGEALLAKSLVYLPRTASPGKVAKLRARGARLVLHGDDCLDAEIEARRVARERGMVYVSPYNDYEVMAGQGTVAIEILEQLQEEEAWRSRGEGIGGSSSSSESSAAAAAAAEGSDPELFVYIPVGGGGLIGGMAAVLKAALGPRVRVIGCSPAASDVMAQSVAAGRIIECAVGDTLSDATAGGIEEGAVTLEPCAAGVDEWVNVTEVEIADAMASVIYHHSKLIEGAAGCAVTAFWRQRAALAGRRAVVLACGGNVAVATVAEVLQRGRVLHAGNSAAKADV